VGWRATQDDSGFSDSEAPRSIGHCAYEDYSKNQNVSVVWDKVVIYLL
jgi:hypothetical protein